MVQFSWRARRAASRKITSTAETHADETEMESCTASTIFRTPRTSSEECSVAGSQHDLERGDTRTSATEESVSSSEASSESEWVDVAEGDHQAAAGKKPAFPQIIISLADTPFVFLGVLVFASFLYVFWMYCSTIFVYIIFYPINIIVILVYLTFFVLTWPCRLLVWGVAWILGTTAALGFGLGWEWCGGHPEYGLQCIGPWNHTMAA